MKRYMLLHYGFEKPTQEIMAAWGKWFKENAEHTVDNGGFHSGGREFGHDGVSELPFGPDSITGYTVIKAESLEHASEIAGSNPFISSIRLYEIAEHQG